ncbi:MAG: baseplate tail-tube junction protein [Patescibacteria group bacterium]|nr:baseplate tail-tube junction protein [Patescibacteria group bacterium]
MPVPVSYDIYRKDWVFDLGFNFNLQYPEDLFSAKYGGNFMVFFINEQKYLAEGKSAIKIARPVTKPDGSTVIMERERRPTANLSSVVSRRVNETTMTTGAVALYIPGGIQVNYQMSYDAVDLNFIVGSVVNDMTATLKGGAASLTTREGFGKLVLERIKAIAPSTAELTEKSVAALMATQGVIENPFKQLIFSGPNFRKFNFSFTMYPRNQKEALAINKIIELFKYHMHPEEKDSTGGRFYVVPSDFDIEFYRIVQIGDKTAQTKNIEDSVVFENEFLYAISTCVLTDMSVNYTPAPEGFITHHDGTPLGVVVQMNFVETEILTKKRIVEMNAYKFGNKEIPSAPVTQRSS